MSSLAGRMTAEIEGTLRRPHCAPRVLLVTPQPFYEDRGTPIAVADTARALGQLGCAVDLLAFPIGENVSIPGTALHRCSNPFRVQSVPIGFSANKCLLDASLWRAFERMLSSHRYDVVHAVEEASYLAMTLCRTYCVPFIYDMASAIPVELRRHQVLGRPGFQWALQAMEKRVLRNAAHVVCSMGLADYVRERAPGTRVADWQFTAVSAQASPDQVRRLRSSLNLDGRSRVLLYSGNFAGYQGIDMLFEAFARAAQADPKLTLLCVGASEDAREGWLSRLNSALRSRVRILTRRPRSTMPAFFALADGLVSLRPTSNNFPLKVFEYMAAGKPIVATRGPAHEPVLNPDRAFLCEPTPESVSHAMLDVFRQRSRAESIARSAREHAVNHFGWANFRRLVADVYGSVTSVPLQAPRPAESAGS
jgi:glycosyltransferase involved in cell wall biosynthesis